MTGVTNFYTYTVYTSSIHHMKTTEGHKYSKSIQNVPSFLDMNDVDQPLNYISAQ